jgi:hypothetical protein
MNRAAIGTRPQLIAVTFCASGSLVILTYLGAFFYVYINDPWLTPRATPSMLFWQNAAPTLLAATFILAPIGVLIAMLCGTRPQRIAVFAIVLLLLALPFLVGVP